MNGSCFIDTNILIYAHTDIDLQKQVVAQKIISIEPTYISTQVLQETANILFKKFGFVWSDIETVLNELVINNLLFTNTASTVLQACTTANRYGFSFYDSLIVAAALQSGCVYLMSEDLQSGQTIEGTLKILNPFV